MADMMARPRPMPGGAPTSAGAPRPGGPDKSSLLNPNDMARKVAGGRIRPGMTVRELLGEMGIDVDGPVEQLSGRMKDQLQNSTMAGKLGAGAPNRPPAGPGARPGVAASPMPAAPSGGGIDQLLRSR